MKPRSLSAVLLLIATAGAGCQPRRVERPSTSPPNSNTTAAAAESGDALKPAAASVHPDDGQDGAEETVALVAPERPASIREVEVVDLWANHRYATDFQLENTRFLAFVFLGTDCPLARLFIPTLVDLDSVFRPQGVQLVGIFSNASEDALEMAAFAQDYEVTFPVARDPHGFLAALLGAERTPQVVVVDRELQVRYSGQISDQYRPGGRLPEPKNRFLREALIQLIAGEPVAHPQTLPTGCHIELPQLPRAHRKVTYAEDVAPIFQKKCETCHRPGQVAPFPLQDYEEIRSHALMIAEVVTDRRMPPWLGTTNDERFGEFSNDLRLTDEETETILAWCHTGAPLGDPENLPPPVEWPSQYRIPEPDAVISMAKPFKVPADGVLPYAYFQIPTGFKEDKWVTAVECRPGDPSVVHHILVHITRRKKRLFGLLGMLDLYGTNGEKARVAAQYSFGDSYAPYPEGHAMRIPAGSYLTLEVHYTPNGRATEDLSRIALKFADEPPEHEIRSVLFTKRGFTVPAGHPHVRLQNSWTFPHKSRILALKPHTHMRAKHFRFLLTYPDGTSETLLSVPRWDFEWQLEYRFAEAPVVPAGTVVTTVAILDNSPQNPNNPDPTVDVKWGLQNSDEMIHGRMSIVEYPDEEASRAVAAGG